MKKALFVALVATILTTGCTIRVADMTVASTKNYNINSSKFVKGARVTGEDSYPVILFPTGIPNIKTAMDNAIQQDKCAVGLSDVVMSQLNHAFLVGSIGYRVEGDLIIDTTRAGCESRV
ncbi:hypothetical protein MO767_22000 [Pseudomonas sp. UYIF39]|uniref:hypothetical protein n=1 Tax=Pseudomonas sp. UYIF39 TaxID=1630747 RepID=UPI00249F68AF|nr:hypothetical protein [Pseudomonas sp. UYIF39]MDI3357001.1 hypothetical protein [Pseudomonas sp. UYIF39]